MVHLDTQTGKQNDPIVRRVDLFEDTLVHVWDVHMDVWVVPVHIWDVGNTKGPVKGGACCSVEDTWDAADLILENLTLEHDPA